MFSSRVARNLRCSSSLPCWLLPSSEKHPDGWCVCARIITHTKTTMGESSNPSTSDHRLTQVQSKWSLFVRQRYNDAMEQYGCQLVAICSIFSALGSLRNE